MPSSVDQLVSGLRDSLQQGLQDAQRQAAEAPQRFTDIVRDAGDQVTQIPQHLWDQLKQAAEHPDWLSLLILIALHLRDAVGEPPLSVGAFDPGHGWSRALILTLTPAGGAKLSLAIALGGNGTNGFIVRVDGARDVNLPAQPLLIHVTATGDGEWRFPFGGPVAPPGAAAKLSLDVRLSRPIVPDTGGAVALGVGTPSVVASIERTAEGTLTHAVTLAMGAAEHVDAGLHAKVDLAPFLGDLARVVNVTPVDQRYSPSLRIASGTAPAFDLGYAGA